MAGIRIEVDTASAQRAAKALEKSLKDLGHSAGTNEKEFAKLEKRLVKGMEADKAKNHLDHLQKSLKLTTIESAKFQASIGDTTGAWKTMASGISNATGKLLDFKNVMAGLVVGGAIGAGINKSLSEFKRFETALVDMGKVTARSQAELRDEVMKMPAELGNATALMEGYYQTISAGVTDPIKSLEFLTVASKASKAAHVEQSETVKALSKVMEGYAGAIKTATEAADLLFAIEKEGQTSVAELVPVIGDLAAISHEVGVAQTEMGAAMAVLTKTSGSTAEAATKYKMILTGLYKPQAEMEKLLAKTGYTSGVAMVKQLGLAGAIQKVTEEAGKAGKGLGKYFESHEALIGIAALSARNFETFANSTKAIAMGVGGLNKAYADWQKTMQATDEVFRNTIGRIAIEFGEKLAPKLSEGMRDIAKFADENRESIIGLGDTVSDLAPQVVYLGGVYVGLKASMAIAGVIDLTVTAMQAASTTTALLAAETLALNTAMKSNILVLGSTAAAWAGYKIAVGGALKEQHELQVEAMSDMVAIRERMAKKDPIGYIEMLKEGRPDIMAFLESQQRSLRLEEKHTEELIRRFPYYKTYREQLDKIKEGQENVNKQLEFEKHFIMVARGELDNMTDSWLLYDRGLSITATNQDNLNKRISKAIDLQQSLASAVADTYGIDYGDDDGFAREMADQQAELKKFNRQAIKLKETFKRQSIKLNEDLKKSTMGQYGYEIEKIKEVGQQYKREGHNKITVDKWVTAESARIEKSKVDTNAKILQTYYDRTGDMSDELYANIIESYALDAEALEAAGADKEKVWDDYEKKVTAINAEIAAGGKEAAKGVAKAQAEILKEQEKAIEKQQKAAQQMYEDISDFGADAFYNIWKNGEDGAKDVFESIGDIAMRTFAQIASQQIVVPIIMQMVGGAGIGMGPGGQPIQQGGGLMDYAVGIGKEYLQGKAGGAGTTGWINQFGADYLGFAGGAPGTAAAAYTPSVYASGLPGAAAYTPTSPGSFGGATLGASLAAGGWGSLGYGTIGSWLGLPQGGYSGVGSFIGSTGGYMAGGAIASGMGAAGGAAAGAQMGSIVPVVGTIIGAVLGGVLGSLFGGDEPNNLRVGLMQTGFDYDPLSGRFVPGKAVGTDISREADYMGELAWAERKGSGGGQEEAGQLINDAVGATLDAWSTMITSTAPLLGEKAAQAFADTDLSIVFSEEMLGQFRISNKDAEEDLQAFINYMNAEMFAQQAPVLQLLQEGMVEGLVENYGAVFQVLDEETQNLIADAITDLPDIDIGGDWEAEMEKWGANIDTIASVREYIDAIVGFGAQITGLDPGGVADALWTSIVENRSAEEFVQSLEDQIYTGVAQAVVAGVADSISRAFIAPINASVAVMVQQVIKGGLDAGDAIRGGVAELRVQLEAVKTILDDPAIKELYRELQTAIAPIIPESAYRVPTAPTKTPADIAIDETKKLSDFMAGIAGQIEEMGLNDIQLQFKQLADEMEANKLKANELGAAEGDLTYQRIEALDVLKTSELVTAITEQIEDVQAEIAGTTGELRLKRISARYDFDASDIANQQAVLDWFETADPEAIGTYAYSAKGGLGMLLSAIRFFADESVEIAQSAADAANTIYRIQETQARLKGELEEFTLGEMGKRYGADLFAENIQKEFVEAFKTTDPTIIADLEKALKLPVGAIVADIEYLVKGLEKSTKIIEGIRSAQERILAPDVTPESVLAKYGLAAVSPLEVINKVLSTTAEDINRTAEALGWDASVIEKDILWLFGYIKDQVGVTRTAYKTALQTEINRLQSELDGLNKALDTARDDYLYYLNEEINAQQTIADTAKDAANNLRDLKKSLLDYQKSLAITGPTIGPAEAYAASFEEWKRTVQETRSADLDIAMAAMDRLPEVSADWLDASRRANALAEDYNADLSAVRAVLTTTQDIADLQADKQDDIADAAEVQVKKLRDVVEEISGTTRAVKDLDDAAAAYYKAEEKVAEFEKTSKLQYYKEELSKLDIIDASVISISDALAAYTKAITDKQNIDLNVDWSGLDGDQTQALGLLAEVVGKYGWENDITLNFTSELAENFTGSFENAMGLLNFIITDAGGWESDAAVAFITNYSGFDAQALIDQQGNLGFLAAEGGWESAATLAYIANTSTFNTGSFEERMSILGFVGDRSGWGSIATAAMVAELSNDGDIAWGDINSAMIAAGVVDETVLKTIRGVYENGGLTQEQLGDMFGAFGVDDELVARVFAEVDHDITGSEITIANDPFSKLLTETTFDEFASAFLGLSDFWKTADPALYTALGGLVDVPGGLFSMVDMQLATIRELTKITAAITNISIATAPIIEQPSIAPATPISTVAPTAPTPIIAPIESPIPVHIPYTPPTPVVTPSPEPIALSDVLAENNWSAAAFADYIINVSPEEAAATLSDYGVTSTEQIANAMSLGTGIPVTADQVSDYLPGFALGGWASGSQNGYPAMLHGTELILNPPQVSGLQRAITGGQNNGELIKLVKELIAENKDLKSKIERIGYESVKTDKKILSLIQRFDIEGLPPERAA